MSSGRSGGSGTGCAGSPWHRHRRPEDPLSRSARTAYLRGNRDHRALALAAATLNDALSDYYRSDSRVYNEAREIGITDEEWRAIKHGPEPHNDE